MNPTNTSTPSVADQMRAEEVQRVAISAGRATTANTWIAFAALMLSLAVIAAGGIFGYAQLIDKVNGTARDTEELKAEVRQLSTTVNLMAGRMGVQPHQAPETGLTRSKASPTVFALRTDPALPWETADKEQTGALFLTRLRW